MRPLRRFLALPAERRRLLFGAGFYVGCIRLGLWFLPFRVVRRLVGRASRRRAPAAGGTRPVARDISWAIEAAGRRIPGGKNCLVQALTAQLLFERAGYDVSLRIGVSREAAGRFRAHAWVESQGEILVGGGDLTPYTTFPPLEAKGT